MKKVKLFSFALAALMLGACSSDEIVESGGKPQWNREGKGYINLAIQLPTQPSTRADNPNDNFDDGTPAEYDVKDATLLLFTGETTSNGTITDAELKFNSAYNMNLNFYTEGTTTDQITTTTKITQEINEISAAKGNKVVIKALVVLNNNGLFSVDANNQLLIDNTPFGTDKGLADLNDALKGKFKDITIANTNNGAGLLMANAVMSDTQGGLATTAPSNAKLVGPLVNIDPNKIKNTKAEAEADPAASIWVERAVAKVTVSAADGNLTQGQYDANKLEYKIEGWALDNTNTTSKLVRTGEGFSDWNDYKSSKFTDTDPNKDNYRMIGGTAIATGLYRTYWDKDYNYSTLYNAETGLSTIGGAHDTIHTVILADGTTPGYCYENTTDLNSMTERNLTRVILKVKFNNGKPFYTVDDERDTIWTEDNVKTEVATRLLTQGPNTLYDWVKANATSKFVSNDLTITLSDETAGKRTVEGVALSESGKGKLSAEAITEFESTIATKAKTIANTLIDLYYYAGGIAYYPIYIKHFGDDLTPWTAPTAGAPTYDTDANFLGRYGVLRNNWYDIKVNSIKGLGEPNVTEVTNEPVDKVNYYISVDINVLSWAKRTQEVDL